MYNVWWIFIGFASIIAVLLISMLIVIIYNKIQYDDIYCAYIPISLAISGIMLIGFVVSLAVAITNPLAAKKEYSEYIRTYELVEDIYDSNQTIENVGLTNKVIELNQWLASARADKETYGNWSIYYAIDLDNLEYIKLSNN